MVKNNFNSSRGAISKLLLILAIVLLVVIVGIFSFLRLSKTSGGEQKKEAQPVEEIKPPEPVYDITVSDIRFILESSANLGSVLKAKTAVQRDITTTEKFIKVTVGAQNKGKVNTAQYAWDVGNIIDSEGRIFISIDNKVYYFLPKPNLCGAVLKPEFEPTLCVKYYEVSKASEGLKVEVKNTSDKSAKKQKYFLDLKIE